MRIRPATVADWPAIWSIVGPTVRNGETYAVDPAMGEAEAMSYWMGTDRETFVTEDADGTILGTYYIRPNQGGGGGHVCNCGYMTAAMATGRGIARRMALHSIDHGKARGFRAMQFNFVVSTNARAIRLWESLGFDTVGRLPSAFLHPEQGYVDALIMYRTL